jgi:hypothetical protein
MLKYKCVYTRILFNKKLLSDVFIITILELNRSREYFRKISIFFFFYLNLDSILNKKKEEKMDLIDIDSALDELERLEEESNEKKISMMKIYFLKNHLTFLFILRRSFISNN